MFICFGCRQCACNHLEGFLWDGYGSLAATVTAFFAFFLLVVLLLLPPPLLPAGCLPAGFDFLGSTFVTLEPGAAASVGPAALAERHRRDATILIQDSKDLDVVFVSLFFFKKKGTYCQDDWWCTD